ncbi:MAG: AAA family ATPase [Comamonas sp.]
MSNIVAIAQPAQPAAQGVYTEQDLAKVEEIKAWLADQKQSRSWLSKKADMPSGTLSQILSGKYVSSPSKKLDQLLTVLATESERLAGGTAGYVQGSVHKLMRVVCDRTRTHANFGVVTGYVGVGKSRFCAEYRKINRMTLVVEVSPNMTPGVLLSELLKQLNTTEPAGLDRKFRELVRVLRGTNYLIVADEAERLSASAMEYLRRVRDLAGVGVVLVGTEKLASLIKPQHGQFDQVRSRVGMWPTTIQRISRDDADDMARAALGMPADQGGAGELADDVLDALWAYSQGSARVLNENLIPALRDYGLKHLPLTGKLVERIASTVLYMDRPGA